MRPLKPGELILASHNPGKLDEFRTLLAPHGLTVIPAGALGLPEPEETGTTFAENAAIKALAAARAGDRPALADDSGLEVKALAGAPGVYSARWAGPDKDFGMAMHRVNAELGALPDRSAQFVCVLCLAWPDGHTDLYSGAIAGQIVWPPQGDGGFGYDPVFVPEGRQKTFAEMLPDEKHAISHRGRAIAAMIAGCFGRTAPG